jgi:hypothetical protein
VHTRKALSVGQSHHSLRRDPSHWLYPAPRRSGLRPRQARACTAPCAHIAALPDALQSRCGPGDVQGEQPGDRVDQLDPSAGALLKRLSGAITNRATEAPSFKARSSMHATCCGAALACAASLHSEERGALTGRPVALCQGAPHKLTARERVADRAGRLAVPRMRALLEEASAMRDAESEAAVAALAAKYQVDQRLLRLVLRHNKLPPRPQ